MSVPEPTAIVLVVEYDKSAPSVQVLVFKSSVPAVIVRIPLVACVRLFVISWTEMPVLFIVIL